MTNDADTGRRPQVNMRRTFPAILLPASALLLVALVGVRWIGAAGSPAITGLPYVFIAGQGVTPKWTPEAAAAKALDYIATMERTVGRRLAEPKVLSVEVVKGDSVAAATGGENNFPEYPIVWIVKATGTFKPEFGLPGTEEYGTSGTLYFDDDTGEIIGSTMQLQ